MGATSKRFTEADQLLSVKQKVLGGATVMVQLRIVNLVHDGSSSIVELTEVIDMARNAINSSSYSTVWTKVIS